MVQKTIFRKRSLNRKAKPLWFCSPYKFVGGGRGRGVCPVTEDFAYRKKGCGEFADVNMSI